MSSWRGYLQKQYVGKSIHVLSSYNNSCRCIGHRVKVLAVYEDHFDVLSMQDNKQYTVSLSTDDFVSVS